MKQQIKTKIMALQSMSWAFSPRVLSIECGNSKGVLTGILLAGQFLFEYCDELWFNRIRRRKSFLYFVLGKGAALAEPVA